MSTITFKFPTGVLVQDTVSGLEGIINGRVEWINGCKQYSVQPRVKKDDPSKKPDSWWIDEAQLEELADANNPITIDKKGTGGPYSRS